MRIRRASASRVRAPLSTPYELSFATLEAFDSIVVTIERSDGAIGIGEAVALPGYGSETTVGILDTLSRLLADASGMSTEDLLERARVAWPHAPFAASAVATAIELPDWLRHARADFGFAINAAVAPGDTRSALGLAAERALDLGHRHLKLKIGRDVAKDLAATRSLLEGLPGREFHLVMDANQAYTLSAAEQYVHAVAEMDRGRLLWLEQPVDRHDWIAMESLCRATDVPIVLDECIYDEADVRRAGALGARGIKLKVCKNLGLAETVRLAGVAHGLGLLVVLGNGVATDLGNLAELLVLSAAPSLFREPSESSGFAKLVRPVSASGLGLTVDQGRITCRSTPDELARELARPRAQP